MYAPKFQSWLTDEQRFSMALDYKLNVMAEKALAEIRAMADDAKALFKEPVSDKSYYEQSQEALNALYRDFAVSMNVRDREYELLANSKNPLSNFLYGYRNDPYSWFSL